MPDLARRLIAWRRPGDRDRGAYGALLAMLLAGGMIVGMGALVVDVGRIYTERQELQTGADAAALAAARLCAGGKCDAASLLGLPTTLAGKNSSDLKANAEFCGRERSPLLSECDEPAANLTSCIGDRPAGKNFVEVRTSTLTSDDGTVLPPKFTRAFLGDSYAGTTVAACARARWGPPKKKIKTLSLAISRCAWEKATANGTFFAANVPTWALTFNSNERYLTEHTAGCSTPGGDFAWLDGTDDDDCRRSSEVDGTAEGVPSTEWKTTFGCRWDRIFDWLIDAIDFVHYKVNYLPVYDNTPEPTDSTNKKFRYKILGYTAVVLTSFAVPGLFNVPVWTPSWNSVLVCSKYPPPIPILVPPPPHCLSGFFIRDSVRGPVGEGADFGLTAIELSG